MSASSSPDLTPSRETPLGCLECSRTYDSENQHRCCSGGLGEDRNEDQYHRNLPVSPFQETFLGSLGSPRKLPTFETLGPPSPCNPTPARLPAIPVFDGLGSDLPDIAELSLWCDDHSDGPHLSPKPSQAALDHCNVDLTDSGDDSRDNSFASNATGSADTSSDMSFGPFTPSASNTRIALRDFGGDSTRKRGLPRGVGLGILGLDFDPTFQSTFADSSSPMGARKNRVDHVIIGPEVYGADTPYGLNSPTGASFGFGEEPLFTSGPTLTSIPECDSWSELGEVLCPSVPRPDGLDSANTSFSSSDCDNSSHGEEDDPSYGLDLSFSFPAQRSPPSSNAEHSTPPRRRSRAKTFSSPTISSDLKRALSLGSKTNPIPRTVTPSAQQSPTITSMSAAAEDSEPFEITASLPAEFWSRASPYPSSSAGDEFGGPEGSVGRGRDVQRCVAGVMPHSPVSHPRSSHRRWRM